ncbi:MAG: PaaI family thioesterase [Pyrinomonadaceae bacterium]
MIEGKLTASHLRRVQRAIHSVPFARLLGIQLEGIGNGVATLALKVRKELTQNHGVVHGGAIASLIDTATAFAIISILPARDKVTTVDLICHLWPATRGQLKATARVVRSGRRFLVFPLTFLQATKP